MVERRTPGAQRTSHHLRYRAEVGELETIAVWPVSWAAVRENDAPMVAPWDELHRSGVEGAILEREPDVDVPIDPVRAVVGGVLVPRSVLGAHRRLHHGNRSDLPDGDAPALLAPRGPLLVRYW